MATTAQKMRKQFDYQHTLYATSSNLMDLFVSTDDLANYLAEQMRADVRRIRPQVKAELERMVKADLAARWEQVNGRSSRSDRQDHYFLVPAGMTDRPWA
jgi:FMN phosphatase YigB (HAD superfamily)